MKTEVAELTHAKNLLESEINLFVGNMANMLSRPDMVIEATMDAVRERVKTLYGTQDNSQRTIKILEQKLLEGKRLSPVLEPVLNLLFCHCQNLCPNIYPQQLHCH